jgi:Baseplate J-like protein
LENYRNTELGTHRSRRSPAALDPSYVVLDDSSPLDLLQEAIKLAHSLRFVPADGGDGMDWEQWLTASTGDWSGFLGEVDGPLYLAFKRFMDDPEGYVPTNGDPLSQPHVALFVAFLRVLQHASRELNGFSQRHMDYYMDQVLQLAPQPASPAEVYVTFEKQPAAAPTILPSGTILQAGDASESELFALEETLDLNGAKIAQIAASRVEFAPVGLWSMLDLQAEDKGMGAILAYIWDHGPNRRITNDHGWDSFASIYAFITSMRKEDRENRQDFPAETLQLTIDEFRRMMTLLPQAMPPSAADEELMRKWEGLHARMVLWDAYRPTEKIASVANNKDLLDKLSAALFNGLKLPNYDNLPVDLFQLYQDSKRPNSPKEAIHATAYIRNVLYMDTSDFQAMYDMSLSSQGLPKLPAAIAEATIRKASRLSPILIRKQWTKVSATADARTLHRASNGTQNSWFPFGLISSDPNANATPEAFGLLVESPVLAMSEGERTVKITLDLAPNKFDLLEGMFLLSTASHTDWYAPFTFRLSGEKDWMEVDWRSSGPALAQRTPPVLSAATRQITFTLHVPAEMPAVTSPGAKFPDAGLIGKAPLLNIRLAPHRPNFLMPEVPQALFLQALQLEKITLAVQVSGLRGYQAENLQGQINVAAPFLPFGNAPGPRAEFMVAHPEICLKTLDQLDFSLDWMDLPSNLEAYYDPYFVKMGDSPAITTIAHKNSDLTVATEWVTGRRAARVSTQQAFLTANVSVSSMNVDPLEEVAAAAVQENWKTPLDWPRFVRWVYEADWTPDKEYEIAQRRLTTALIQTSNDFAAASAAYSVSPTGSSTIVNAAGATVTVTNLVRFNDASKALNAVSKIALQPPYVPKLKRMQLGYKAQVEIPLAGWSEQPLRQEHLYHQTPFGYQALPIGIGSPQSLLPAFEDEGAVMIGLEALRPGDRLSFLLKVQPGSGNPDVLPPAVHWLYATHAGWRDLPALNIRKDETNGLTQTGILQFVIPADATRSVSEMPGGLFWLMGRVATHCEYLPDWENLHLHAERARQLLAGRPPGQRWALPAGNVTQLQTYNAAVAKVVQPYPSEEGRPAEAAAQFYDRVAERLRHKNRALMAWDYEHICLARFPNLYAVKTWQATAASGHLPGELRMVVVPDLRGLEFSDPFQPKFGFGELNEIAAALRSLAPSSATVTARNPTYRPVVVATTINFNDSISTATGQQLVQERLKAFLAPWAFGNAKSMAFGGRLYVSQIIDVLQAEPYVDFIGKTRLFLGDAAGVYVEATALSGDTSAYIEVGDVDVITSGPTHLINQVDDENVKDEIWEGIGWMVINQDLKIKPDPFVAVEQFDDWLGISWMVIGKDFKVM